MTSATTSAITDEEFVSQWQHWHSEHEKRRADRHGFLAVTGLHFLTGEPQTIDRAPGQWWTDDTGVHVDLAPEEHLSIDGKDVTEHWDFGVIAERDSLFVGYGDAVIEVAKRGGNDIIRPRHPDNPIVVAYQGTRSFEPTQDWVVTGVFERFAEPRPTLVGAAVEGLEHVYDAVGTISFSHEGQNLSLVAFPGKTDDSFIALFVDATSGVSTYGLVRTLSVAAPGADGTVTLDFNRAVNLPCAYTPHATCPLPPAENRLTIEVTAGELAPEENPA